MGLRPGSPGPARRRAARRPAWSRRHAQGDRAGQPRHARAGYRGLSFSDPFGLCVPWPQCEWDAAAARVTAGAVEAGLLVSQVFSEVLTSVGDVFRLATGVDHTTGTELDGSGYAMASVGVAAGLVPGGGGGVQGSKAAVRAGLGGLDLSDDVAQGVRRALGSGGGQLWGVHRLEDGGAMVHRFVQGDNTVSSAVYTYRVAPDGSTKVAKQAYEATGYIEGTTKSY